MIRTYFPKPKPPMLVRYNKAICKTCGRLNYTLDKKRRIICGRCENNIDNIRKKKKRRRITRRLKLIEKNKHFFILEKFFEKKIHITTRKLYIIY